MRATSSAGRSTQGFALYELVLALAILSLVAAVVMPRVAREPGPAELRSSAQQIAALLRADRNAALRSGADVVSRVNLEEASITSGAASGILNLPSGAKIQFLQSSSEARGEEGGIRFRPDGRSSGGVLVLERGGTAYEVSVNWLTSGVTVGVAGQSRRLRQ